MSETSRLAQAARLLRSTYGTAATIPVDSEWMRCLTVILFGNQVPRGEAQAAALESPALSHPRRTVETAAGQLAEVLAPIPRGAQKASLLRAIADWWLSQFGDDLSGDWSRGVDYFRDSLRKIRGLGPATVDEFLMIVARLPVFPVNRSAVRVAVRHGWLDLPLEDDEAQSFFVQGLAQAEVNLVEFSSWIDRVGQAHCGRVPACEGCPLQTVLPPNGPLNPDAC